MVDDGRGKGKGEGDGDEVRKESSMSGKGEVRRRNLSCPPRPVFDSVFGVYGKTDARHGGLAAVLGDNCWWVLHLIGSKSISAGLVALPSAPENEHFTFHFTKSKLIP